MSDFSKMWNKSVRSPEKKRVFLLSLHRTATESTDQLFENIGFSSIHTPIGRRNFTDYFNLSRGLKGRETDNHFILNSLMDRLENRYDAVCDGVTTLYEEAYERYPNAKFILVSREPEGWLNSIRNHIGDRELVLSEKIMYWKYLKDKPKTLAEVKDDDLLGMAQEHRNDVEVFFASRSEARSNFISVDLENNEAGQQISTFLGAEPQSLPRVDRNQSLVIGSAINILNKFRR